MLDSYAVLAFLFQEGGYAKVMALLEKVVQADQYVLVSAANWAEIRCVIERKLGAARWNEVRMKLLGLPIEIVPMDQQLAELAGEIKATWKMSLADCFAAALAKQRKAEVYTGDSDFRAIKSQIDIIWI